MTKKSTPVDLYDLLRKGARLQAAHSSLYRRMRNSTAMFAVLVAKAFLRAGYDVYTDADEGGDPDSVITILVKGLPEEFGRRAERMPLIEVRDYDEYLDFMPVSPETLNIVRLTEDGLDGIARRYWRLS